MQLRLAKLAYRHVRPSDDVRHEGTYTPDTRDNTENARDNLLGAVLDLSGSEGWSTKMAMINDPLFAHFSDRGRILAEQKAAEEADAATLSESESRHWIRMAKHRQTRSMQCTSCSVTAWTTSMTPFCKIPRRASNGR
ncbi:hypothetical protein GOC23_29085 [Sinorhizobium meliloti]|nr:hypothetical protein [Sinorhizobium meliloti]